MFSSKLAAIEGLQRVVYYALRNNLPVFLTEDEIKEIPVYTLQFQETEIYLILKRDEETLYYRLGFKSDDYDLSEYFFEDYKSFVKSFLLVLDEIDEDLSRWDKEYLDLYLNEGRIEIVEKIDGKFDYKKID